MRIHYPLSQTRLGRVWLRVSITAYFGNPGCMKRSRPPKLMSSNYALHCKHRILSDPVQITVGRAMALAGIGYGTDVPQLYRFRVSARPKKHHRSYAVLKFN